MDVTSNIPNSICQNDPHFMFYPTVWKSIAKMI